MLPVGSKNISSMGWVGNTSLPSLLPCVVALVLCAANVSGRSQASGKPETKDLHVKYRMDAEDYVWKANGEASEARAASHEARAKIATRRAGEAAARLNVQHGINSGYLAPVQSEAAAAAASAKTAEAWLDKQKALLQTLDAKAYAAAKASAEAKVAELKAGGAAYYAELLAKLNAKASAGPMNPKAAAAAKAAGPYMALVLQCLGVVAGYNLYAQKLLWAGKAQVKTAFAFANVANQMQGAGNSEMAMRKMLQAHGLVADAGLKEGLAKNVYKLAREINAAIPEFQKAAQEMAEHVLATVQVSATDSTVGHPQTGIKARNPFLHKTQKLSLADSRKMQKQTLEEQREQVQRETKDLEKALQGAISGEQGIDEAGDGGVHEVIAASTVASDMELQNTATAAAEIEASIDSLDADTSQVEAQLANFANKAFKKDEKEIADDEKSISSMIASVHPH